MFALLVNPVSGGGAGAALVDPIEASLSARGIASRRYATCGENDATYKARQALDEGCEALVCIGGDGTLSELVGVLAHSQVTLYLVPCGTGNDFARALRLPKDPLRALNAQLDGQPVRVDCGTLNGMGFINVSGSGFDVDVLRRTEQLKARYPGAQAYRRAVFDTLSRYRPFEATLTIEDGKPRHERATIIEIANGQYIGGGMRVAPDASVRDGLLDVMVVRAVPRGLIPLLLPLFMLGAHARVPGLVHHVRATRVTLCSPGMTVNVDGRLLEMDKAEYTVLPGALCMRLPARFSKKR